MTSSFVLFIVPTRTTLTRAHTRGAPALSLVSPSVGSTIPLGFQ
jgi:hypothetical protein